MILQSANNYEYFLDKDDNVFAAVEIKKVQWYQWEIRHLTVSKFYEGKGYGTKLVKKAEKKAQARHNQIMNLFDDLAGEVKDQREFRTIVPHQIQRNSKRIEKLETKVFVS